MNMRALRDRRKPKERSKPWWVSRTNKEMFKNLGQPTTSKNIRESKFQKRRPSFNLRFKLTKDENCEMVIFRFYCKIIFRPSELT